MFLFRPTRLPVFLLLGSSLVMSACSYNTHNIGVGGGVGTTGGYIEGKYAASNHLVLRANANVLPVSTEQNYDGVDYEASVDMVTIGGFADIYPFRNNGFNVTAGIYGGDKSAELLGTPDATQTVEIGNMTYTGAQIGTLRGEIRYADAAPFLGIGYDGFMNHNRLWSFNARAGVMFVGDPEVDLTAEGGLVSLDPTVQSELEREEDNLQDELDQYKYYPVISVGVTRRF